MKAYISSAAAGVALLASVGAADAATYNLSFTKVAGSAAVPATFYAVAEADTAEGIGSSFDVLGYDEVISSYTWIGNTVAIVGTLGSLSASLSLNLVDYTFTFLADQSTWAFGTFTAEEIAPVPVPAALPLMLGALGAAGVVARRRKTPTEA